MTHLKHPYILLTPNGDLKAQFGYKSVMVDTIIVCDVFENVIRREI